MTAERIQLWQVNEPVIRSLESDDLSIAAEVGSYNEYTFNVSRLSHPRRARAATSRDSSGRAATWPPR
jgi:hypothetical protein